MNAIDSMDKLTHFLSEDNTPALDNYYAMAMEATFEDVLMDIGYIDEEGEFDFDAAEEELPDEILSTLHNLCFEFFCTTTYAEEETGKVWNFIDSFMSSKKDELSPEEIAYYQAFRDSYLGLYEVTNIDDSGNLTLKGLVNQDPHKLVVVHQMNPVEVEVGAIIAARVLNLNGQFMVPAFFIGFDKDRPAGLISLLDEMTDEMSNEGGEDLLTLQKNWVSFIMAEWLDYILEDLESDEESEEEAA